MEVIEVNGVTYPVLNADEKGYVNCPFCGQKHKHGKANGDGAQRE